MKLLIGAPLVASALALPSPHNVKSRASPITNQQQLAAALKGVTDAGSAQSIFQNIVPASAPTSIAQEQAGVTRVRASNPADIFESGADILLAGLAGDDFETIAKAYLVESNTMNFNFREPIRPVYPKAGPLDAPYDLSERELRQAIYIPPDSGAVAGQNFAPNYGKLFKEQDVADPVYLNLPGQNLADIQVAAEYTAYAINYISGISGGRKVSQISTAPETMLMYRKGEHRVLVRRLTR
jgi:hypothetical protein